jgi:hypothetical protein
MREVHLVDIRARVVVDGAADTLEVLLAGWPDDAVEALSAALRARGISARPVPVAALPVLAGGGEAAVLALGPFTADDRQRIERAASLIAERALEARAAARHTAIREDVAQLFRKEALEQYQRGSTAEGHLLELEPRWTRYAYGVLLAFIVAALLFAFLVLRGLYA